jgi:predicted O-linked N-acetylglucosamine transferase (SPINDLY family)
MNLQQMAAEALSLHQQGRESEAEPLYLKILAVSPHDLTASCMLGAIRFHQQRPEEATALFDAALKAHPAVAGPWMFYGQLLQAAFRLDRALDCFDQVLRLDPNNLEALIGRGATLRNLGRFADAVKSFDAALALNPNHFDAWLNRGSALRDQGQFELALQSFDKAIAIAPNAAAFNNRGNALRDLKRFDEALASFDGALALDPANRLLRLNRTLVLLGMSRFDEALTASGQLLKEQADDPRLHHNHGKALEGLLRLEEALESQKRAIALASQFAEAHFACGELLTKMARHEEALESYDRALSIAPDFPDALYNRGNLLWLKFHRLGAARKDLEKAFRLDPERPYLKGDLVQLNVELCDWNRLADNVDGLTKGIRQGHRIVRPTIYQALSSSPADLQRASMIYAQDRFPAQTPLVRGHARRPGKIRLGYLGGEFREHAMALLMVGLYEHHDRSKFEVIAFDVGWNDGSPLRKRLEASFDKWVDLSHLTDRQRAERIRDEDIDILVNIIGYFQSEPMGVFAYRPAPVQVSFLGYPATLGAHYIDYLIADRIVIPEEEQRFYTEKIVYLPDTYWANDSKRLIADTVPSRSNCGLPDQGFVFCNFNHIYKLTPDTFALWMGILKATGNSVLWMLESNDEFAPRLRSEAEKLGVAGERLIFAPPVPPAEHLARIKLADLSLDSLPYNAHTTACDCLWVGVPILTLRGSTFPGRVAASLLEAMGLPELIRENPADYREAAQKLAGDAATLESIRRKLWQNRLTTPLFDTARFCRHIEAAYEAMSERSQRGEAPHGFSVAPLS